MLVVFDTNILVSALIRGRGSEFQAVELFQLQQIGAAVSHDVLTEYRSVLSRSKFKLTSATLNAFLATFHNYALLTTPQRSLTVSSHPADNRFLECAEAASADFLVTGNLRHFPAQHGVTRIVRAPDLLAHLA